MILRDLTQQGEYSENCTVLLQCLFNLFTVQSIEISSGRLFAFSLFCSGTAMLSPGHVDGGSMA